MEEASLQTPTTRLTPAWLTRSGQPLTLNWPTAHRAPRSPRNRVGSAGTRRAQGLARCRESRECWSEVGLWVDVAPGPNSPSYLPAPQVQVGDTPVPGTCWLVTRALLGNRMRASGEGNVGAGTAGSLRGLWECGGATPAAGTPEDRQGQHSRGWGWSGDDTQLCPGLWGLGGGEEGQAGRGPPVWGHPHPPWCPDQSP